MKLPEEFKEKMKGLLGEEWQAFYESCQEERAYGLRRNSLKSDRISFEKRAPFELFPVPWAEEGYYYRKEDLPGRNRLHEAGAYYIQEPSAMSAVSVLNPQPGERICDLCAAPGGKSTQIAGRMQGKGILVANEAYPSRAAILSQNMERMGVRNSVVLNEKTEKLAQVFRDYFDRVLVDAPCSGEGMFRKEEAVCGEWSQRQVELCAKRQKVILDDAAQLVKGGGVLVYSTCTFSPEENEGVICDFLEKHPEYTLADCKCPGIQEHGRVDFGRYCLMKGWISEGGEKEISKLSKTLRLWPHKLWGEGHFVAKLIKTAETTHAAGKRKDHIKGEKNRELWDAYHGFAKENLKADVFAQGQAPVAFGSLLCAVPGEMISLRGLRVIRAGVVLGTYRKSRFEPDHALAMALNGCEVLRKHELGHDAPAYFAGELVCSNAPNGWLLMETDGFSSGWGKAVGGRIKNHYPKGLRKALVL